VSITSHEVDGKRYKIVHKRRNTFPSFPSAALRFLELKSGGEMTGRAFFGTVEIWREQLEAVPLMKPQRDNP